MEKKRKQIYRERERDHNDIDRLYKIFQTTDYIKIGIREKAKVEFKD